MMKKYKELMCNMRIIVNNVLLHSEFLLKEKIIAAFATGGI
jgi:hypothetical protein